jgi:3-dehydroquinate dehydratase-1
MQKCFIGNCELGSRPRTVAIIDRPLWIEDIIRLEKIGADILEIRVDSFAQDIQKTRAFIEDVKKVCSLPLIGTIRENTNTVDKRLEYFKTILPLVDAVDVELDGEISSQVIALAQDKTIIVSEHDFAGTPETARLHEMVQKAVALGANIVKIAVLAATREDVVRLLKFVDECEENIVAFSMGEYGTVSRVLSMLFGSLFSYGFVTHANAPGQLSIEKLIEECRLYFPEMTL